MCTIVVEDSYRRNSKAEFNVTSNVSSGGFLNDPLSRYTRHEALPEIVSV